jgi:hypothetical protein
MGIQKNYLLANGVEVKYWELVTLQVDIKNAKGAVKLKGYLDQESAESGKTSLINHDIQINFGSLDPQGQLLMAVEMLVANTLVFEDPAQEEEPPVQEPEPEQPLIV